MTRYVTPAHDLSPLARRYAVAKAAGYPDWQSYCEASEEERARRLEANRQQDRRDAEFDQAYGDHVKHESSSVLYRVTIRKHDGSLWFKDYPTLDEAHNAYTWALEQSWSVSGACERV